MNRNGLSSVLSNLLLIVLGFLAFAIFSSYVYSFVNDSDLSPSLTCLEMQTQKIVELGGACFNNKTNDVEVILNNLNEIYLDNIYLGFDDGNLFSCGEDCLSCEVLEVAGSKKYYLAGTGNEEKVNLKIFDCDVGSLEIKDC